MVLVHQAQILMPCWQRGTVVSKLLLFIFVVVVVVAKHLYYDDVLDVIFMLLNFIRSIITQRMCNCYLLLVYY